MDENLIVVRQLPVIEDQLRQIKANVEARVNEALSLACTEETRTTVKKARAELNKEYGELETRRKEVKAAIMAPYEKFETLYRECAGDIYKSADAKLKARIAEVEDGLRQQKADEVEAYFEEYRESVGLESSLVDFASSGIKITLSDSKKTLKAKEKAFLDGVVADLAVIEVQEHSEEIMVEYRRTRNLSQAITAVDQRLKAIELERKHREELRAQSAAQIEAQEKIEEIISEETAVEPPVVIPQEEPDAVAGLYSTSFKVTGTLEALKALKKFLVEGGYTYEQL